MSIIEFISYLSYVIAYDFEYPGFVVLANIAYDFSYGLAHNLLMTDLYYDTLKIKKSQNDAQLSMYVYV